LDQKGIVIGVILLFIGSSVIPITAQNVEKLFPTTRGNWLYVGGSGPGNYTRIQDAIDDASNGDTVFVYAASSPYYENVIVNKSINLMGEDKNTTIINGKRIDDSIWIKASFVNVSGFTILNSSTEDMHAGITVIEKKSWEPDDPPWLANICISDCIIKSNRCGIRFYSSHRGNISSCVINDNPSCSIYIISSSYVNVNDCVINHNGDVYPGGIVIARDYTLWISDNVTVWNCSIFNNNGDGLRLIDGACDIEISYNKIFENTNCGIFVSQSNAKIFNNNIYNNGVGGLFDGGIVLQDCINRVTINNNNIETNNQYGLYLLRSSVNSVTKNNFINNTVNAYFQHFSLLNHWIGNYWTDWIGIGPKLINGKLKEVSILWFNFDWRPAQKPYDILG
jgi:parallel beta-helix repeat protein